MKDTATPNVVDPDLRNRDSDEEKSSESGTSGRIRGVGALNSYTPRPAEKEAGARYNGEYHENGVDQPDRGSNGIVNRSMNGSSANAQLANGHSVNGSVNESVDGLSADGFLVNGSSVNGLFGKELSSSGPEADQFLSCHLNGSMSSIRTLGMASAGVVEQTLPELTDAVFCREKLNHSRYLNKFLESINLKLAPEGVFSGFVETSEDRKRRLRSGNTALLTWLFTPVDFVINRAFPKLKLTRSLYFSITRGRNRVISLSEMLGRLASCGFEVQSFRPINGFTYIVARKVQQPVYDNDATYGLVVRLNRIGKDGKNIRLFKLRTMHPYSEYIQDYVFQQNHLKNGGKFDNDFRVTRWGKWLRRFWLDEQPMWINYFRGEVKLVGVRPLSPQYFRLYPEWMQQYRTRFKPGLIPPFYADMPVTLEEIVESERRYLRRYEKKPFITDLRYFFRCMFNILFRSARSS